MVDIATPRPLDLSADDFLFRTGNDTQDPFAWQDAPAPTEISLFQGAGVGGSDRIVFVWDEDSAVRNAWLQVTVLPTSRTGLVQQDVFYFGSAVGETGNADGSTRVDATDMLLVRQNQQSLLNPASIDNPYDFNRDGKVDASDMLIARQNQTNFLTDLKLLTAPLNAPTSLRAEVFSGSEIRIAWHDHSQAAEAYRVFATELPSGMGMSASSAQPEFVKLATVSGDTSAVLVSGLAPQTNYLFRVEGVASDNAQPTVSTGQSIQARTLQENDPGFYEITISNPSLSRNEADYTGEGQAQVVKELVAANSPEAAIWLAVEGYADITSTEGQQRTFEFPSSGAFKVGMLADLEEQLSGAGFDRPSGLSDEQFLIVLEDTYQWTNIDEDYDDFYWLIDFQMTGLKFIAHRTGENFDIPVSDEIKKENDPSDYVNLTNNNFDQEAPIRDYDQETADLSGEDPDLVKMTLKALPEGLDQGVVSITLSSPNVARLFRDDGTVLYDPRDSEADPSVLTVDLSDPGDSYLADLMSADVDVWLEGLEPNPNFRFSLVYMNDACGTMVWDDIHMTVAQWTFVDLQGNEVIAPAPLWIDALLAAAEDGPWMEQIDDGGGSSPSFFKSRIQALPFSLSHELTVASDQHASDIFEDELEETTDGSIVSKYFAVLYNSDMYLAADHGPLTSPERDLILNNLMLNAVHNQAAIGNLKANQDEHQRGVFKEVPIVFTGLGVDLFGAGATIQGTAKVDSANWELYDVHVKLFRDRQLVDSTDFFNMKPDQDFEFILDEPGLYSVEASGWPPSGGSHPWAIGQFTILVDDEEL